MQGLVTKVNEDGTANLDFAQDGIAIIRQSVSGELHLEDGALDHQDRLLVAGWAITPQAGVQMAVARLLPNGVPDPSFGHDGLLLRSLNDSTSSKAFAVAANGDKILVAGEIERNGRLRFAVVSLLPNGDPDQEFLNEYGFRVTGFLPTISSSAKSIAINQSGMIYVTGTATETSVEDGLSQFATISIRQNGASNSGFGSGGKVRSTLVDGMDSEAIGVIIDRDGGIVVAGTSFGSFPTTSVNGTAGSVFSMVRYHQNGSIDTDFGDAGLVLTDFGDSTRAIADSMDSRGREIYIAGSVNKDKASFAIAAYGPTGNPTLSFGGTGQMTVEWSGQNVYGGGVQLLSDGPVLIAGTRADAPQKLYSAKLQANGKMETSYGNNGKASFDEGAQWLLNSHLGDVVQGPDGYYLVGSTSMLGSFSKKIVLEEMRVELSWAPDHSGVNRLEEFLNAFNAKVMEITLGQICVEKFRVLDEVTSSSIGKYTNYDISPENFDRVFLRNSVGAVPKTANLWESPYVSSPKADIEGQIHLDEFDLDKKATELAEAWLLAKYGPLIIGKSLLEIIASNSIIEVPPYEMEISTSTPEALILIEGEDILTESQKEKLSVQKADGEMIAMDEIVGLVLIRPDGSRLSLGQSMYAQRNGANNAGHANGKIIMELDGIQEVDYFRVSFRHKWRKWGSKALSKLSVNKDFGFNVKTGNFLNDTFPVASMLDTGKYTFTAEAVATDLDSIQFQYHHGVRYGGYRAGVDRHTLETTYVIKIGEEAYELQMGDYDTLHWKRGSFGDIWD